MLSPNIMVLLAITIIPVLGLSMLAYQAFKSAEEEDAARRPGTANIKRLIGSYILTSIAQGVFWVIVLPSQILFPVFVDNSWFFYVAAGVWSTIWGSKLYISWKGSRELEGYTFSRYSVINNALIVIGLISIVAVTARLIVLLIDPPASFTYGQEVFEPVSAEVAPGDYLEIPIYGTRRNTDALTLLFGKYNCDGARWYKDVVWESNNVIDADPEESDIPTTWGFTYRTLVPSDIPVGADCEFVQVAINLPAVALQSYETHFSTVSGEIHVSD